MTNIIHDKLTKKETIKLLDKAIAAMKKVNRHLESFGRTLKARSNDC